EQVLAFLIRDFQGFRKPGVQSSVHQRITDHEQKNQRQQRYAHRSSDHLYLEAGAHLPAAPFFPDAQQRSRQDQPENQQRRRTYRRQREEDHQRIAFLRAHRQVQRSQGKDRRHQHGQKDRKSTRLN